MSTHTALDPEAIAHGLELAANLFRDGLTDDRAFPEQAVAINVSLSSPEGVLRIAAANGVDALVGDEWTSAEIPLGVGTNTDSSLPSYMGAVTLSLYAITPRSAVIVDTDTGEVLTEPMSPANAVVVANATSVVGRRVHVQAVTSP